MWWIIGILVVGFIIYKVNKNHKEHVNAHVSNFGGMMVKYGILIGYLESGGVQVQKVSKARICFRPKTGISCEMFCSLPSVSPHSLNVDSCSML